MFCQFPKPQTQLIMSELSFVDPLLAHVLYLTEEPEHRRKVTTNLILEALDYLDLRVPLNFLALKNWELLLLSIPNIEKRNEVFTKVVDSGVTFSDGTDGLLWAASKGLYYRQISARHIVQLRKRNSFRSSQLERFRAYLKQNPNLYGKAARVWNQLQRQLNLIADSAYTVSATRKPVTQK